MSEGKTNSWEAGNFGSFLWSAHLIEKARAAKFLIYILLLIISGFGNMFSIAIPKIKFFNRNITSSKQYISAFYANDTRKYIEEIGWYDQAVKCGVVPSSEKIKYFIESQPQFRDSGGFSAEKYSSYLKENALKEYEMIDFYGKRMAIDSFKKAIFFEENSDKYEVSQKLLSYSIFSADNTIDFGLEIDKEEFREFLLKSLHKNRRYIVDDEKLSVQYIEVRGGTRPTHKDMSKLRDRLKMCSDIEKECKEVHGANAEIKTFLLPMSSKGRYHAINFVFDKCYVKSNADTTMYAVVKDVEPRSLKNPRFLDLELLKKTYLGQMSYKTRFLKIAQLNEPNGLELVNKATFDTSKLEDIRRLQQNNLLFMKKNSVQMFKNSDGDLFLAVLEDAKVGEKDSEKSALCEKFLSRVTTHNFFLESVIEYWISRSAENI